MKSMVVGNFTVSLKNNSESSFIGFRMLEPCKILEISSDFLEHSIEYPAEEFVRRFNPYIVMELSRYTDWKLPLEDKIKIYNWVKKELENVLEPSF